MKAEKIINLVRLIRRKLEFENLNDPGIICRILDIPIRQITLNPKVYPAYTTNINGSNKCSLYNVFTISIMRS